MGKKKDQAAHPIAIGDIVRHTLNGFTGTVVGRSRWLHNCDRMTLQPELEKKTDTLPKAYAFDAHRLEYVKPGRITPTALNYGSSGADLGDIAEDELTGLRGEVIAIVEDINGCVSYAIERDVLGKDGQPHDVPWVDAVRIKLIKKRTTPAPTVTSGGPRDDYERAIVS